MTVTVRHRGNRHAQLPPNYVCLGCRAGEHDDCVDKLTPRLASGPRMCVCAHPVGKVPYQPPVAPTFSTISKRGGLASLDESRLVEESGRAKPRRIQRDNPGPEESTDSQSS